MKCNVGRTEQVIRVISSIVIILISLYFKSWWGLIGIVSIITGSIRYCPISDIIGVSTCHTKKE